MIYVIKCGRGYICKGLYVVYGEKYKVIGGIGEARKFKTEDAAQREAERLNNSYKYKDFSEHESPFCQGIDINMKIYPMIV